MIMFLSLSYSQKEDYNWIFADSIHIDFNTNPPTINTIPQYLLPHGCSSISDKNGNLLLYFDIKNMYNSQHQQMLSLLRITGLKRLIRVVPHPTANNNFFYVSSVQSSQYKLRQAIYLIDMNTNAGKGKITKLSTMDTEEYITNKFLITRKFNSNDYWLLRFRDGKVIRNTINSSGLKDDTSVEDFMEVNHIKVSPDMSKLFFLGSSRTKFYIADYDFKTAEIKNIKQFAEDNDTNGKPRIFEFSRNGNYLFHISNQYKINGDTTRTIAIKYNMSAINNINSFINSADTLPVINPTNMRFENPRDASLAPDGKIYIAVLHSKYFYLITLIIMQVLIVILIVIHLHLTIRACRHKHYVGTSATATHQPNKIQHTHTQNQEHTQ